jgi:hypothetical protein
MTVMSARFHRSPSRRSRTWSFVLALVMLALLPVSWDNALERDRLLRSGAGYATGAPSEEEHREEGVPVERRSSSAARAPAPPPALALAVKLGPRVASARHAAAPHRRVSPYIPHPSRFSERRLI